MYRTIQPLILASGSPRRKQLLSDLGIKFDVVVSAVEEIPGGAEKPEELVKRLALSKARSVASTANNAWIIGADTDVAVDGHILGKPIDTQDAVRLLMKIQGRTHEVWGGIALIHPPTKTEHILTSCSLVTISKFTEEFARRYVATGEPMDKAGAYAAQGVGAQLIEKIVGSYTNVVGLDIHQAVTSLINFGIIE